MLITILRWLALPLSLVAVPAAGVLLAFGLVALADGRCVDMVGGACVEPWHTTAVEWAIAASVAAVLLLMPVAAGRIAPLGKRPVTIVAAVLGVALLGALAVRTGWGGLGTLTGVALVAALVGVTIALRGQRDDGTAGGTEA